MDVMILSLAAAPAGPPGALLGFGRVVPGASAQADPYRPLEPWHRQAAVSEADSDESLMLAYAAGDATAFEALYQRFRRPLFAFLQRGLQDASAAEECFQDVWTNVIRSRHRYQPTAKLSTWLFQIAHNRMVDSWRRQRPNESLDALQDSGDALPDLQAISPELAADGFQLQRRLRDALAELPLAQRVALQLRLEEELSLEEIADITDSGRETVKSRLRYAMARLRAQLGGRAA